MNVTEEWLKNYMDRYHKEVKGDGLTQGINAEAALPSIPKGALGVGRKPKREMNGTELEFSQYLQLQKLAGLIVDWWFEAIQLRVGRVGERCWWKMDFLVRNKDGSTVIYDTKGTKRLKNGRTTPLAEDDAIVKARAVAEHFAFPVYFVWKEKNGEWQFREM